jgi:hypothetical protein
LNPVFSIVKRCLFRIPTSTEPFISNTGDLSIIERPPPNSRAPPESAQDLTVKILGRPFASYLNVTLTA